MSAPTVVSRNEFTDESGKKYIEVTERVMISSAETAGMTNAEVHEYIASKVASNVETGVKGVVADIHGEGHLALSEGVAMEGVALVNSDFDNSLRTQSYRAATAQVDGSSSAENSFTE